MNIGIILPMVFLPLLMGKLMDWNILSFGGTFTVALVMMVSAIVYIAHSPWELPGRHLRARPALFDDLLQKLIVRCLKERGVHDSRDGPVQDFVEQAVLAVPVAGDAVFLVQRFAVGWARYRTAPSLNRRYCFGISPVRSDSM